jgi:4a-hydroxytetrahydrobiopterin dehydratase
VAATGGALTDAQIAAELQTLPGWRHENRALRRTYKTDGWPTTLLLVNAVGFVCESADHHPDLAVSWGKVEVSFWTHSAGGITAKDVAMARAVDKAALWRPEGWKGTAKGWVSPEG